MGDNQIADADLAPILRQVGRRAAQPVENGCGVVVSGRANDTALAKIGANVVEIRF